jgi:hypothetical protein
MLTNKKIYKLLKKNLLLRKDADPLEIFLEKAKGIDVK